MSREETGLNDEGVTGRRKWPYIAAVALVLAAIGAFLLLVVVLEPPDSLAELKALPLYKGAQGVNFQKLGLVEGRDTSVLTFLTPDQPLRSSTTMRRCSIIQARPSSAPTAS